MAITRPVTKSLISTVGWGVPITDAVNANTTAIANNVPTAWTTPTLTNGWVSYGAGFATAQYRKIGDMVYIRGLIANGTLGAVCFSLPTGFRPPAALQFAQTAGNGALGTLQISGDGSVVPNGAFSYAYTINCAFSISS